MREVLTFSILTVVLVLVFTHFYNLSIPEHEYPSLFKFLKKL